MKNRFQRMRNELKIWMNEYNDPLLDVYENRANEEKVRDELYQMYPDLKRVDEIWINESDFETDITN